MASHSSRCGIRIRAALITAVYYKAINTEGIHSHVSDILALCSSDCHRLYEGVSLFHFLWSGPLEALTIIVLLVILTGRSALVGLGLILVLLPLQFVFAWIITKIRGKNITATDIRVQMMHEILLGPKQKKKNSRLKSPTF